MNQHGPRKDSAFTLAEVVVSIGIMFVVMGGLTASIVLATRAMPRSDERWRAAESLTVASETLIDDLLCATSITSRSANSIEFAIPDRTGDHLPETVRYAWNSIAGTALTRTLNGDSSILIDRVAEFSLRYDVRSRTEQELTVTDVTSAETLLASFTNWGGLGVWVGGPLTGTEWASQSFSTLSAVAADALSITFTRASLNLAADISSPVDDYYVQLFTTTSDRHTPSGPGIGDAVHGLGSGLSAVPQKFTWPLVGATTDDPFAGHAIVVRGKSGEYAQVQRWDYSAAPANGTIGRWSSNSGSSWLPTAANQLNRYDHPFEVFATWVTQNRSVSTVTRYYLTRVGVTVRAADAASTRVHTGTRLLNQPEVATP